MVHFGYFTSLSLAVNSNDHVFAGTWHSGIFRSTDNGAIWTPIGPTFDEIHALATNFDDEIYAGTQGGSVFRSTDNGESWTEFNFGLTPFDITNLSINRS